jgi:hypothetical protein
LDAAVFETDLAAYMERLQLLAQFADAGTPAKFAANGSTKTFLEKLKKEIAAKPVIAAFAAGYSILSLLRIVIGGGATGADAAALAVHWGLDRKLRQCFEGLGVPGDEAQGLIETMKTVLARTSPDDIAPYLTAVTGKALGATLFQENYTAEDFRKLLRINRFEDVTWFNKEAFEKALFYVPLFLLMESDAAFQEIVRPPLKDGEKDTAYGKAVKTKAQGSKKAAAQAKAVSPVEGQADVTAEFYQRAETLALVTEALAKAEAASGYRLDEFIGVLLEENGKKPSSPKAPHKGTGKIKKA